MKLLAARSAVLIPQVLLLAACAAGGSDVDRPQAPAEPPTPTADGDRGPTFGAGSPDRSVGEGSTSLPPPADDGSWTVFTLVFENHDYAEVIGSDDAPFFNELARTYAVAANYSDCNIHPSLPNYLCMVSGDPQVPHGTSVEPTTAFAGGAFPIARENLASQLVRAGVFWRSYQEDMREPCFLANDGSYAPKHNPFLYFSDVQRDPGGLCARTNVPYTELAADMELARNRYYFITPNLIHGGHHPSDDSRAALRTSDAWARAEIGKIMSSKAFTRGRSVLFVTWDEGAGRVGESEDRVPMIIVSQHLAQFGVRIRTAYSHRSYLATVEDLLGLPRLATVRNEPSMRGLLRP